MPVDKTIVTVAEENGLADIEFSATDSLYNNIWLSIKIPRGSFLNDPSFGSRLHTLKGKVTNKSIEIAKMYSLECIEWLKITGRALNIEVDTSINTEINTRIDIDVTITRADNEQVTYSMWYDVI